MRVSLCGLLLISFLTSTSAFAQTRSEGGPLAFWTRNDQFKRQLIISFGAHLTEKQRNSIDSGFSTYSDFMIKEVSGLNKADLSPLRILCSVKFDAWQEQYEVTKAGRELKHSIAKKFDEYASECLTMSIDDVLLEDSMLRGNTKMVISLQINQVSPSKSDEIRKWLVRQQGGVMQGLFAHMLGDLNLTERLEVRISIPPVTNRLEKER